MTKRINIKIIKYGIDLYFSFRTKGFNTFFLILKKYGFIKFFTQI